MNINIPALKIESIDDGTLMLEQDWSGNVDRIAIHPMHVRLMAEALGLQKVAPTSELELRRQLDRLRRDMLRVREHSLQMRKNMRDSPAWDHCDLTFEVGQVNTLVDLLDMAVDDFVDQYAPQELDDAAPVETASKGRPPERTHTEPSDMAQLTLED